MRQSPAQPSAERLWQLTVEHSPVGMTLVSPEGVLMTANRALCSMLGHTEAELKILTFQQITHPDDVESDLALFLAVLADERPTYRITKRYLHADGSVVWGDLSVALMRADDGTPLHFIGQIVDVTAQRHHEKLLEEAAEAIDHERRMSQAILDTVDVGLVLLDRDGHYERTNRRHRDFMELAFPDGHQDRAGQLGRVYAADGLTLLTSSEMPSTRSVQGEEFDDLLIWVGDDPVTRRALSVCARAVLDTSGSFIGAALAYSDVTELMRALQSREDFVAAVSHELRTPLTSVLGHLEMLLESEDLTPEMVRPLRVVQRNSLRLRGLVSDLLETAQQRKGDLVLFRSLIDVADLLVEARESVLPTATTLGVDLVVDVPRPVQAVVDCERLRQVVDNLVSNAIKYTDPGGRVELAVRPVDDEIEITVTDTGIGIEPGDLDRLFTPFFRAEQAQERVAPGVGLGLGIARAIVLAHGGRIEATSTLDQGSCFRVILPLDVDGAEGRHGGRRRQR